MKLFVSGIIACLTDLNEPNLMMVYGTYLHFHILWWSCFLAFLLVLYSCSSQRLSSSRYRFIVLLLIFLPTPFSWFSIYKMGSFLKTRNISNRQHIFEFYIELIHTFLTLYFYIAFCFQRWIPFLRILAPFRFTTSAPNPENLKSELIPNPIGNFIGCLLTSYMFAGLGAWSLNMDDPKIQLVFKGTVYHIIAICWICLFMCPILLYSISYPLFYASRFHILLFLFPILLPLPFMWIGTFKRLAFIAENVDKMLPNFKRNFDISFYYDVGLTTLAVFYYFSICSSKKFTPLSYLAPFRVKY